MNETIGASFKEVITLGLVEKKPMKMIRLEEEARFDNVYAIGIISF